MTNPSITIPLDEIVITFARSAGPGGQNVNKVSSRVTLRFNVESSPSLSLKQKDRLRERLASRIGADGCLAVNSRRHRSQAMNREAALVRFIELLETALGEIKARVKTRAPKSAEERRLMDKVRRSELKKLRAEKPALD